MCMAAFDKIAEGLDEALAVARGEALPCREIVLSEQDAKFVLHLVRNPPPPNDALQRLLLRAGGLLGDADIDLDAPIVGKVDID